MFGFQQLDVYRCAVSFLPRANVLAAKAGAGHGGLADQLRRAALSIVLNIAEGTGRFGRDQRHFYTIARGSALECAALADAFETLEVVTADELADERQLLVRIVSMLTQMMKS